MVKNGKKIGWKSAAAIVIANMIGTGVFTTLGFQLVEIQNTWSILLLWLLGGVIALLGAVSYAELGTHLRRSGGEYHFISSTIHPFLGYLSGWISLTVGFAAPIALAAIGIGAYMSKILNNDPTITAVSMVIIVSLIHSFNIKQSSRFQDLFTLVKVALIVGLILLSFWLPAPTGGTALEMSNHWMTEVKTPAFAICLVYVTYAFSGWSSAAYIVEEIEAPKKSLPKALIGGAVLVSILYLLLQLAFLRQAPIGALKGKIEVGQIVAEHMFGALGGQWASIFIALFLISSLSAMIWVGPRVTRAMADDYKLWHFLGKDNNNGIPTRAIALQAILSIGLILTGSFEQVLLYSGFILQLSTMLAVAGIFVIRRQSSPGDGYRSPFYPWIQIAYLLISTWIVVFMIVDKPMESIWGLINLGLGAFTFWLDKQFFFLPLPKKNWRDDPVSSIETRPSQKFLG